MLEQTDKNAVDMKIAVQLKPSKTPPKLDLVSEFRLEEESSLLNKRRSKLMRKDIKGDLFASAMDTVEIQASSQSQESFN